MIEAVQAARKHGAIVSYDLNYRPSLWKSIGGPERAQEVNREIARYVDVMIGNEEDFTACLGLAVEGADERLSRIDVTAFKKMIRQAVKAYPNFKVVATTLRAVQTATVMTGAQFAGPAASSTRRRTARTLRFWTVWAAVTVSPAG